MKYTIKSKKSKELLKPKYKEGGSIDFLMPLLEKFKNGGDLEEAKCGSKLMKRKVKKGQEGYKLEKIALKTTVPNKPVNHPDGSKYQPGNSHEEVKYVTKRTKVIPKSDKNTNDATA